MIEGAKVCHDCPARGPCERIQTGNEHVPPHGIEPGSPACAGLRRSAGVRPVTPEESKGLPGTLTRDARA